MTTHAFSKPGIDAPHLKAHRAPVSRLKKGGFQTYRAHQRRSELEASRRLRRQWAPLIILLSEGQMSDYKGAALMLSALPRAKILLGDRGYDADWFRKALAECNISACIPSRKNRKAPIPHDIVLYRQHHKTENMFGRLKDWRRIHTRYDHCAHASMSAICIAATVIFWLNQ